MNPSTLVVGFAPLLLFAVLDGRIPVADAAGVAAAVALVLVAVMARRAVPVLPIVQAVTLAVISVIAFIGDSATQSFLASYGRGIVSLVLAAFMLMTAPIWPFTAAFARASVPRELWGSPRFVGLNRRISTAWGVAVLVLGLSHLVSAAVGSSLPPLRAHLLEWGPAVIAVLFALRYTRRTVAEAHRDQPASTRAPRAR